MPAENGYYSISIYVTALQPWENFNTLFFLKKRRASEVTSTFIFLELGDFVNKKT